MKKLIEYKKFKLIADRLKEHQGEAGKLVFKEASIPKEVADFIPEADPSKLLDQIDFSHIYKVFQSVMKKKTDKIDPIRSQFGEIKKESITVQEKMDKILSLLTEYRTISFKELLEAQSSKVEVIVTFLAILELMKTGCVEIVQEAIFDTIYIHYIGSENNGDY